MPDEQEKERAVLIVVSAAEPREYNNNPVVNFSARKDGEEGAAGYETWGQELVDMVKKDARLDCEIKHIQKQDGMKNRVTQMFDAQGKPIRPPSQRGGGGGRQYGGKSDFQEQMEKVTAEGIAAYTGVIELIKTGKTEGWTKEVETARQYAEMKMREGMKPITMPQPAPAATKATPQKAAVKPADKKTVEKISDEFYEELLALAKDKGYTKEVTTELLKKFSVGTAKEMTVPQGEQFKKLLEKGEGLPKQQPLG